MIYGFYITRYRSTKLQLALQTKIARTCSYFHTPSVWWIRLVVTSSTDHYLLLIIFLLRKFFSLDRSYTPRPRALRISMRFLISTESCKLRDIFESQLCCRDSVEHVLQRRRPAPDLLLQKENADDKIQNKYRMTKIGFSTSKIDLFVLSIVLILAFMLIT